MSDPSLEDDSLISQDDIDKLLDSSSIEEVEEKLSNSDAEADTDVVDDLGELSQDDIDQLMNSNVSSPAETDVKDDIEDDDSDGDDMELISQDDIDQLMNVSSDEKSPPLEDDEDYDEDLEMISQDDINELMTGGGVEADVPDEEDGEIAAEDNPAEDNPEEETPLVEDNIDQDSESTEDVTIDSAPEPVMEEKIPEDDYVIEESEAVDVQDNLITQETIDGLIDNFDNELPLEPLDADEEPNVNTEEEPDSVELSEPVEADAQPEVSSDDSKDLLEPDSDVTVLDFDDDEDGDVTQDDIDSLLLESDDEDEDEDDILISQDDIDTLLMAADQEDEDVLGDLMDDDIGSSMEDDIDEEEYDEDILDSDSFDEYDGDDEDGEDEDGEDPIVLEKDDGSPAVKQKKKKKKKKTKSRWYKSKLVIACVSGLIVLGIAIPTAYFVFFSGEPEQDAQLSRPVAALNTIPQREIEIETVDINVRKPVELKKPGTMLLKDFIILASDLSKDMAYITADISIDYSDQRAYHEINNNLSFYRDLIYDSVNKSLVSEKRDEITEADILWIVETTLKKVLPGHYINRVSFKSFKVS